MDTHNGKPVAWRPNPGRQTEALRGKARQEFEILYGGARGGGKTSAGIAWLSRWIINPKFRALVIRKDAVDLSDWIGKADDLYKHLGAKKSGNPTIFTFPSGAIIKTGHLHTDNAYTAYQGHEYQKILIEELTHIPSETLYEKLLASCRSTVDGLLPQVFCTCNPGEVGHVWVKRRWRIPDEPNDILQGIGDLKPGEVMPLTTFEDHVGNKRIFIPSTIDDNPVLLEKDEGYKKRIEGIEDEATRRRWRYGSWGSYEIKGAYFSHQVIQAERDVRITKVPFMPGIPVDTQWDIGKDDATSIWLNQHIVNRFNHIKYIEEAHNQGLPQFIRLLIQLAQERGYRYRYFVVPHDMEHGEYGTGRTRIELLYEALQSYEFKPFLYNDAKIIPLRRYSIEEGIQAAREVFPLSWFDEEECSQGLNALRNYMREFNEERQAYSNVPLHNWASHGGSAFRYFGLGAREYNAPAQPINTESLIREVNKQAEDMRARLAFTPIELPDAEESVFF
jgi:hypothetical protein